MNDVDTMLAAVRWKVMRNIAVSTVKMRMTRILSRSPAIADMTAANNS